jgi:hypothetical protein
MKILNLSGVVGQLPDHFQYEDLVNLFIERLNVQRPAVYALSTENAVILNSQTIEISGELINIGPYAVLHNLEHNRCEAIWEAFMHYFNSQSRRFIVLETPPEKLREKQLKILKLEQKLEKLEREHKASEGGRMQKQFDEANKLLRLYKSQLVEEKQREIDAQTKNLELVRQVQILQAQIEQHKETMTRLRTNLGDNWETSLDELHQTKAKLEACHKRLTQLGVS